MTRSLTRRLYAVSPAQVIAWKNARLADRQTGGTGVLADRQTDRLVEQADCWTDRQTGGQADCWTDRPAVQQSARRQTDSQAGRETDRLADRQADRQVGGRKEWWTGKPAHRQAGGQTDRLVD